MILVWDDKADKRAFRMQIPDMKTPRPSSPLHNACFSPSAEIAPEYLHQGLIPCPILLPLHRLFILQRSSCAALTLDGLFLMVSRMAENLRNMRHMFPR